MFKKKIIGAGDTDPRIRVRSTGEKLASGIDRDFEKLIRINPSDRDSSIPNPEKNVSICWGALASLTKIDKIVKGENYY